MQTTVAYLSNKRQFNTSSAADSDQEGACFWFVAQIIFADAHPRVSLAV